MRIAKDGKPFDVDHIRDSLRKEEVEIIQFLRPNGRRRRMVAEIGEKHAAMARDMILSAEELMDGTIAVCARFQDEPPELERIELAENGPGPNSPVDMLKRVIEQKTEDREDEKGR